MLASSILGAATFRHFVTCFCRKYLRPTTKPPLVGCAARRSILPTEIRRNSLNDTSSRSTMTTSPKMTLQGSLAILEDSPPLRTLLGHTVLSGHVSVCGYRFRVQLAT